MKRKYAMLVTGLLSVAVVVAACSKEEPAGANGSTSAKRGKINVSVYDRGNIAASEGTIENNRWTKWINENGPVDVSFTAIPRNNAKEKVNTLFSSGSAPDLLFEYSPEIKNPLYAQKQLMPIDDMINKYSTVYKKSAGANARPEKSGTEGGRQAVRIRQAERSDADQHFGHAPRLVEEAEFANAEDDGRAVSGGQSVCGA
ncbi:extracellular solute-binding protein [Paenibacillus sp. P25]|nr:extracellular solute-binding protein [Paenibacillus sp. P25]